MESAPPLKEEDRIVYKNDKAINVLCLKYRTAEEITRDTLESFKEAGLL